MGKTFTTTNMKATGVALLLVVAITLGLSWALFACHIAANAFVFPISILLALVTVHLFDRKASTVKVAITTISIVVLSIVVCALLFDNSYDGNTYHQASILYLADGWNPIYEVCPADNIWSRHYAKALEVISAQIFKTVDATGICSTLYAIESAKAVNLLLFLATILFSTSFIWERFPQISRRNRIGITFVVAANPVVLTQLFTFYNDFALYCLATLLLASFFGILQHDRMAIIVAISATLIAITTKFTHFFFIGVEWSAFFVYLTFRRQWKPLLKWVGNIALVTIVGVALTGFNPYVTNTVSNGHPFYPLMGGGVDIMTKNTPEIYEGGDRVTNFLKSQFTDPDSSAWSAFPLPKSKASLLGVGYDSRSMGFGPLFIWILAASLLILLLGKLPKIAFYISAVILIASFVFPQVWWARYVAFLWLLSVVIVVFANICETNALATKLKVVVYALAIIGGAIPLASQVAKNIATREYETRLFEAVANSQPVKADLAGFESFGLKMNRLGVKYEEVAASTLDLNRCVYMYGKNDGNRYPIVELSAPAYSRLIDDCSSSKLIQIERRRVSQPTK